MTDLVGGLFGDNEESTSTTARQLSAPTPEERRLTESQLRIAQRQLEALATFSAFTLNEFDRFRSVFRNQITKFNPDLKRTTADSLDFLDEQVNSQSRLLQNELEAIERGVELTDDQRELIETAAQSAIDSGLSDIAAFRDDSLRSLAQETAPARGLRPSDTPIVDVGGRVARDATRLASDLVTRVRGQEADAKLRFPIEAGEFISRRTQAQQQLAAGGAGFIEQLRQQSFNNRLNLTALTGNLGARLSTIGPHPSTLAGLQNLRSNTGTSTTAGEGSSSSFTDFLGGVGGFATGLSSLGFSDPALKEDIRPVGELGGLPLYKFKYRGDDDDRIGFMSTDVPVEYVVTHPSGFEMVNYGELLDRV